VTYDEGSNLKLYDLLVTTLELLASGADPEITIRYYELHALDLVGFRPELFQCVECGKEIIEQDQFLSGELGGVVCPDCAPGIVGGGIRPITSRVLKYLRHIQRTDIQDLLTLDISREIKEGLEKVVQYYLEHTLEKHLNSPEFIKQIRKKLN
jgi:DNA repair protein RecO (recombination protein O)